jgi:magnesium-transporting ATPase (P-type)
MEEKEKEEENKIKDINNNNYEEKKSQVDKTLKDKIKTKNKIQSQFLIKEYASKDIPKNKYDNNNNNYISFAVSGKRFISEREEDKKNPKQLNKDKNQKNLQNLKTDNKNNDFIENNNIREYKEQRIIYIDLNNSNKDNLIGNKEDIIEIQKKKYSNNSIRTCQYTLLTFLPLAIFNQFKTAFNWFFLFSFILVCIPQISDKSPLAEAPPFTIVMIISLVKEAIEDYRKYTNDKKANNAKVLIFKDTKFCIEKCQNIRVGNIIKIHKDELIPADVLVIKSSLKNGLCYMQTSNLDGENVLKPREAFTLTQNTILNKDKVKQIFEYKDSHFFIEVIPPNKDIYDIEGTVFYKNEQNYISIKNVLLRGARLKNVDYIYGIVLYNGHDTKLMQNIGHSSLKMSTIDKKLNYIILIIFIACIIINIISSILGVHFRNKNLPNYKKGEIKAEYLLYYRTEETKTSLEIIRIMTNNFLIYTTFIPISIIISNAFCKIIQTVYLQLFTQKYKLE